MNDDSGQLRNGLTSAEADSKFAIAGPNEIETRNKTGEFRRLIGILTEPLSLILLAASGLSLIVGEVVNGSIIGLMVILSAMLNFIQTSRSAAAAERLRKQISLTATVRRDGEWSEIPRRDVVPDDLVRLGAGDLVPADAELVTARDLHLQEASLTGESLPVEKVPGDRVFLGTSVVSGVGEAVVTATGQQTEYGAVAARLVDKTPETDFERGTRRFGFLIARVVLLLVVFVFLVNALARRDTLESLFFAIALAVGLTPEFLPMIMTVTLGRGAALMSRQHVIVKHLAAIQNFGSMDILCSDKTGTLTEGTLRLTAHLDAGEKESERVFRLAFLNSYFQTGVDNPLDRAILERASPLDQAILKHEQPDVSAYRKTDELPFDFERRRMSVIVRDGGERLFITKGAPESVLEACDRCELGAVVALDPELRARIMGSFRTASLAGSRVIAVAFKDADRDAGFTLADESGLVFAGFLCFADEPLKSASEILRRLAADGVEVKILTGDSELVAAYVAREVGFDGAGIVTGEELDRMSDEALANVAERTKIFARVSPMQKHRVIIALKSRGHVVGFLGDGINDAPSLRSADVGISVSTATDVAKDAAEIVLLGRGLEVLHAGIIEGRKSFGNVMKYLLMGTSSNFGNMFSMAAAVVVLPFLPMLPVQILLNNFLYDLAQITIPTDNVDRTFIRKPHRWDVKIIRDFMIYIGPISSIYDFLTFYILLKVFNAGEQLFQTGWFVESLATQTLVVFVIRTAGRPWRSRPSLPLTLTVLGVIAAAVALPFSPLGPLLGFVPLPVSYFIFLGAATLTYLVLVEAAKRRLIGRFFG